MENNENFLRPKRGSDFKHDAEHFGKIGEEDLKSVLLSSNKTVELIDTSSREDFYDYDIDIVQMTEGGHTLDEVLAILRQNSIHKIPFAHTYEAKADTVSVSSRNIIYEVLSHDNPGCLAKSKAEFIYYAFLDKNDNVVERYLIDLKKWRQWIREHCKDCNRSKYLILNNFDRTHDGVMNFLCNIDKMVEDGVAKDVNKLKNF